MERVWIYKKGSLMLKRWTHLFNPEKDHLRFHHIWVLLSGFPLAFWNLEAFKEIGNSIGKFMYVDPQHLTGLDRRVGKLLVELDLKFGLPAEVDIEWCGFVHQQRLEYVRIIFRCATCKEMGHLHHGFPGIRKVFPPFNSGSDPVLEEVAQQTSSSDALVEDA
jgi:hypothetical protein